MRFLIPLKSISENCRFPGVELLHISDAVRDIAAFPSIWFQWDECLMLRHNKQQSSSSFFFLFFPLHCQTQISSTWRPFYVFLFAELPLQDKPQPIRASSCVEFKWCMDGWEACRYCSLTFIFWMRLQIKCHLSLLSWMRMEREKIYGISIKMEESSTNIFPKPCKF